MMNRLGSPHQCNNCSGHQRNPNRACGAKGRLNRSAQACIGMCEIVETTEKRAW